MKLKTFFISYIIFLSILFAALSTISVYLTDHQMNSLREQSMLESERIADAIEREVNALHGRGESREVINALIESHIALHRRHGTELSVEANQDFYDPTTTFNTSDGHYTIAVHRTVMTGGGAFQIEVTAAVTEQMTELYDVQRVLLILFITFSLATAVVLYIVLNRIFKPLELVAFSTEKIAEGDYSERISIKGTNELALMASNFNQMAEVIEKHIEKLKGEAERKQKLIDNLAHELRTPLTSIYGYAEYMQKAKLTEDDKIESTSFIMEESAYMHRMTNSMLELAKLRNFTPIIAEVNIAELFSQIATSLEMTFQDYKVRLVTQPIDGSIQGQSDLIKSLITNLCMNAAKVCTADVGRVVLKVKLTKNKVEISVSDNGCGISKGHIDKLMEPFYQVDAARNKARGGVGLGLAIVKQIAEIHGAEIKIESEVGSGTEVTVIFNKSIITG